MSSLLKELFELREKQIINPVDVESVVDDFKFAINHIKSKIDDPNNISFDNLVTILKTEMNLTKQEAGVIANLLKK